MSVAIRDRLPLAEARAIADDLVALLMPACERIEVCGSIRRKNRDIGDIDIVAIPRLAAIEVQGQQAGLFGEVEPQQVDVLAHTLNQLCGEQVIRQARKSNGSVLGWGPRLKHGVYRDLKVQVQSVEADVFGMYLVIRTGPASYSHAFVTPRGQKAVIRNARGEVIAYREGMLPPGFSVENGFRLHRAHVFVPTPEERHVYEALGWDWPRPEDRR